MPQIKTAISISEDLFKKVEELARELSVSRSRVFALAVQELVKLHENRRLLEAINAAHLGPSDDKEKRLQTRMRTKQREILDGQW